MWSNCTREREKAVHHIPAIHAAKVGMRYPARVVERLYDSLQLELDLQALAPGRNSTLRAVLRFDQTVFRSLAMALYTGSQMEVVLIAADRERGDLVASFPADPTWLAWNTGTVCQIAQRIRETGETFLFPVLADALEEAGCTEPALLARCREPDGDNLDWLVTLLATQE
jgi:hypothetical protein